MPGSRLRVTMGPIARQMPASTSSPDSAAPAVTSPSSQSGSNRTAAAKKASLGEASCRFWLIA
ncbi:hypothetical protein D3C72_1258010 [compost metagenome]